MLRGRSIDEWIMDVATSAPPAGREDWARAMRAEFESLGEPRTGWALGCLGAAIEWRFKADWGYLLALGLVAVFSWPAMLLPIFWAFRVHLVPPDLTEPVFRYGRFLIPMTVCLGFAAARPRYWMLAGIGFPLTFVSVGVIEAARDFHSSVWDVHPFNATLEVGTAAQIGYCLIGALVGRSLGSALRGASAPAGNATAS
jgi:hypothetical protein